MRPLNNGDQRDAAPVDCSGAFTQAARIALPQEPSTAGIDSVLSVSPEWTQGFFDDESDGERCFRWMGERAEGSLPPSARTRYLELHVFSVFKDRSQVLEVRTGPHRHAVELPLGSAPVSICLPADGLAVALRCTKTVPVDFLDGSDRRFLTVRISVVGTQRSP